VILVYSEIKGCRWKTCRKNFCRIR